MKTQNVIYTPLSKSANKFDFTDNMPTIPADIRISVRRKDSATRKIELVALPYASEKYWVRIDGKKSQKLEVTTITEVTNKLREWLCQGAKK